MIPSTKDLILSSGMKLCEISKKSGYSLRTINNWLNNKTEPSFRVYFNLCEVFGHEASVTMNLQLALKSGYFEDVKSGIKHEEFRLYNDYWKKRLIGRNYENLILTKGYPKRTDESRIMRFKYCGYTVKTITHHHFGRKPVKVFAIHINQEEA